MTTKETTSWYNFDTAFRSLKDELRAFLKERGIYYELSGVFAAWHFEIKCTYSELLEINAWLDEHTIIEEA